MIEARELRIGNWVRGDRNMESEDVTVNSINEHGINLHAEEIYMAGPSEISIVHDYWFQHITRIPLTKDWLIKFGFKERKHCEDWYIELPETDTILSYRRSQLRICPSNQMCCLHTNCDNVHTLQNYFYALTNTELTTTT